MLISVSALIIASVLVFGAIFGFVGCTGAAVILFGTTISQASGKVAGTVFSKNRSGPFIRGHVKPINPRSAAQTNVRASQKYLVESWGQLGADVINAWNALGSFIQKSGRLGHKHYMTGEDLYISCNRNLVSVAQPYITAAPDISSNNVQQTLVVVFSVAAGVVNLAWTGALTAGTSLEIMASGNLSGGRKYNSRYFLFNAIAATTVSPMDMSTAYIAKFGVVASAGQIVFFRWRTIDQASGFASGWSSQGYSC